MDLPPELKLCIAELLDPESAFNFAIACRYHWSLCTRLISKHARLFEENRILGSFPGKKNVWKKAVEFALKDPMPGMFVRSIVLPPNAYDSSVEDAWLQLSGEEVDRLGEEADKIEAQYRYSDILSEYTGGEEDWLIERPLEDEIGGGDITGPIGLLAHYAPHLQTMECSQNPVSWGLLTRIVLAYTPNYRRSTISGLPLQKLTTVALCGSEPEYCRLFMSLPSLENVVVYNMEEEISPEEPRREPFPSNVKDLTILRSRIHRSALSHLLSNCKAMERFTYWVSAEDPDRVYWGSQAPVLSMPRYVMGQISRHLSDSLEHLELKFEELDFDLNEEEDYEEGLAQEEKEKEADNESPDDRNPGERAKKQKLSLRHFQRLKSLRCDYRLLYPEYGVENCDATDEPLPGENTFFSKNEWDPLLNNSNLREILPESLESLHLEGTFNDEEWTAINKKLIDTPDSEGLTPNLKSVYIERDGTSEFLKSEHGEAFPGIWHAPLAKHLKGMGIEGYPEGLK